LFPPGVFCGSWEPVTGGVFAAIRFCPANIHNSIVSFWRGPAVLRPSAT